MTRLRLLRLRRVSWKAALAFVCTVGPSASVWAQFEASAKHSLNSDAMFAMTSGDFNRDGRLDIAVVGNELSILLGNGDGSFQKPTSYLTAGYSIAVGDFNGDGIPDLVVTNIGSSVSVLLGNGDGTFQSPIISPTTEFAYFVAVGDFNGDGKPDLAVIDPPYVSILLGNGDGTFQTPTDNSSFVGPHELAVGDFNNDHRTDVVVVGFSFGSSNVGVLLGNGDGTLQPPLTYPLVYQPEWVSAADFNRDGNLDVAISDSAEALGVTVLLGNGDGSFQPGVTYYAPVSGPIAIAEFHPGGNLDLVLGGGPPAEVGEFLGNGDGTFQPAQFYGAGAGGAPLAGDFNHDGKPDLVLLNEDLGVTTMLNTGTLIFSPSAPVVFPVQLVGTASSPRTVALANAGGAAVSIRSITVAGNFQASDNCGGVVSPGGRCSIVVRFEPNAAGGRHGRITLLDSESSKPQFVLLSGLATPLSRSPSQINFGPQKVGTGSSPQTITVSNVSDSAVTFKAVQVGGDDNNDFHESNNCTPELAAEASCTISVTFTPHKTGPRTGNVNFEIFGGANPPFVILKGTGD